MVSTVILIDGHSILTGQFDTVKATKRSLQNIIYETLVKYRIHINH